MNSPAVKLSQKFWKITLLTAIFVVPILLSSVLYYYRHDIPVKATNRGYLLQPPLATQWLVQATGMPRKWHIVYFPKQCCNQPCDQRLQKLYKLYTALGKERPRVDVTVLLSSNQCQLAESAGLHVVRLSSHQVDQFQRQLAATRSLELAEEQQRFYIIDPLGNLILFYQQKQPYMAIYKDLKRLLKVSSIG